MTRILFGQSYFLRFDPKLWDAMRPYPPLGTLYATSVMRDAGYEVALFDAMLAESTAGWAAALDHYAPRYAVLYEDNFNYLSKMCLLNMREAAFEMIGMAKTRGCTVVVAGSDATDHAASYLQAGADYALIGEGEETLKELLLALDSQDDADLSEIQGLAYRNKEGHLRINPRRPDIRQLDELPFPAWDLVDIARYRSIWLERHGVFSMNMVTTRGCPFHCNWCAKPIWGQRYNSRSPENVVEEMKMLKEQFAPDHIWFADDIFGLKPGWLARFAEVAQANDALIPYKCLSRADLLLREGDIAALRRSGCQIVWIGAESGAQKILDAMEKGTTVAQIRQAARLLRQHGVKVGFFLQFGYPGETRADIEKTLQLIRDCQPDDIGISVSYPLPGTPFHRMVRDQLSAKQNWIDSGDLDMMYAGPFTTAFYRQLHTVVHQEFRARQTWRRLRQRQPVSILEMVKMIYRGLRLPLFRLALERLARARHQGISPLPQVLQPAEAAQPSPQACQLDES